MQSNERKNGLALSTKWEWIPACAGMTEKEKRKKRKKKKKEEKERRKRKKKKKEKEEKERKSGLIV